MSLVSGTLAALRRRPFLAFLVFAGFFGAAMAGIYLKKPAYESVGKLLVNFEGRGVSLSRADVQYNSTQLQAVEAVTSQSEILRSHDLVVAVVDKLGMDAFRDPEPSSALMQAIAGTIRTVSEAINGVLVSARLVEPVDPREALIEAVEKSLQVYPVRQTQVISVAFRWRNPRVPPLVLDALIELFQAKVGELNGLSDGYDLFVEQSKRARDELDKAERDMSALGQRYKIVDLKREKTFLLDRIEKLGPVADIAAANGADTALDGTGAGQGDSTIVGGQISALQAQLNTMRVDRARLLVSVTPDSREVRELDRQIATVEAALARESRIVRETLAAYRERLRTLQGVESDFNRAGRNLEIASEAYQTYRKASEDRRVMKAQEVKIRIQVIDPPTRPVLPTGPSRLILALAALVAALALIPAFGLLLWWLEERRMAARFPGLHETGGRPLRPQLAAEGGSGRLR
ncbi:MULTISPECIES: hypothetical protein [Methylobacterium]|uniref:Lipopolysaccharide biosynthesis protein n=5 Tax=Pseudomonadota TaxID=1224 RepID=A0ABQ4SUM0_9HYPH|nr:MULTISPECIES: hypothetical protein [Methylobacterium]PIU07051.1 MAG: hypothetical protein COT56_06555 [Methylobacterium sp. CG09_land_8_20_14_0_10_71_15]PIU12256.1 MAG: hypothetical protein COT28_15755 [Methylobacterium sp. CG08_land_8_20_14_0_20_71_15]GBU16739.1 hypothetical protein AwMethylo_09540 [Methylobacterium sp.]GJE05469.1 hypothetical protein AOPFMNJM_0769 [Methylobacterium jeotgali]